MSRCRSANERTISCNASQPSPEPAQPGTSGTGGTEIVRPSGSSTVSVSSIA